MSGVAVVRSLLAANTDLLAAVPAARIMAGDLPLKITLPAIGVKHISGMPYLMVDNKAGPRLRTHRVQVTVLVKFADQEGGGYPSLRAILKLARAACPNVHGTVNGFNVDAIVEDIEGPDLSDAEQLILSGSLDLIVKYSE